MRRAFLAATAAAASAALSLASSALSAPPAPASQGEVAFANSGEPAAQAAFQRGVALLHNFQYPEAVKAFAAARSADPGFALAYWGEAMAHNHAVWMEQDAVKARAVLAALGPDPASRLARAPTARERGLIEAVEALYGAGTKEQRDFAYSARMERLHHAFPADVDIASFYALSLLGLAHKGRDYSLYMRAAAILELFFPANRRHPGVVHYLIHSYDDPIHAPLGLRAARLYGDIAPDSHHAQHMISHIYIALPDWAATIEANRRAMAVADRDRLAEGKKPVSCGHYATWKYYAFLQTGERGKASDMLSRCRGDAALELGGGKLTERGSMAGSFVAMRTQWIVETGAEPAVAPLTVAADKWPVEAFDLAYGDLLLARGRPDKVAAAAARLKSAAAKVPLAGMHPLAAKGQRIVLLQAQGLNAIAGGRREAGLAALREAAEIERTMEVPFGPPMVEKPSFELLGEELLEAGRRDEAADAFRQALKLAPGRRVSTTRLAALGDGRPDAALAATGAHKH